MTERRKENTPLFIFEMANNHGGSVEHGIRIVQELKEVVKDFPEFSFCVKLQYRDLETCIHPDFRTRTDLKYIKRFTGTSLTFGKYKQIKNAITDAGFLSMCTPSDEVSVEKIVEHGYDYIKIPSCYLCDWPLIEAIGKTSLPVVASTAGHGLEDIDKVVSFFAHRGRKLSLMHCVAEYPTPYDHLNLGQISLLKNRYPQLEIGYSTHEDPTELPEFASIKIAVALGATLFEKHVGISAEAFALNAYSATPHQIRMWLYGAQDALQAIGSTTDRYKPTQAEQDALRGLQRGAYAAKQIVDGDVLKPSDVFFAMPCTSLLQADTEDFSKYCEFTALNTVEPNQPIMFADFEVKNTREQVLEIVKDVKALIQKSGVQVPGQCELEISHHYGLDKFRDFGVTMITVVNRSYCKKLLVVLPGQRHPEQWHEDKDETYHVLYGGVSVYLDGEIKGYMANQIVTIPRRVRHSFVSHGGAVIEEISSSYEPADSFYFDEKITANKNRKTYVSHWMDV